MRSWTIPITDCSLTIPVNLRLQKIFVTAQMSTYGVYKANDFMVQGEAMEQATWKQISWFTVFNGATLCRLYAIA